MFALARCGFGVFLLLLAMAVWAEVNIPPLSHRVTDLTGTLDGQQLSDLENKLAAFETEKGSQIAVLILQTTKPEDIAQFGIRVAEAWKIGRKQVDDGVILIVAKEDRTLRLEVGYGLEGAIPDAVAKRVISDTITPFFKAGDYGGGIDAGVTQLMQLIAGEPLPEPVPAYHSQMNEAAFMFIIVGGLVLGGLLSLFLGRVMGGMLAGLGAGTIAALFFGFGFVVVLIAILVFFSNRSTALGWRQLD